MLYAIIARDIPASQERRLASRPAHLARLEQLKEEGRLVLAGPHPAIDSNDPGAAGFTGSLIVAEFDSLAAAQSWAEADPTGPPGCMPRWWSSRSRKSCPEAVAGHRRPARSPSRQTFSHRTPLSGARRSATRPARRFRQAGRANRKTVQSVASSVQGVMMRPSTAHCLLLSLSLGASWPRPRNPRQHRFQPRSLPLRRLPPNWSAAWWKRNASATNWSVVCARRTASCASSCRRPRRSGNRRCSQKSRPGMSPAPPPPCSRSSSAP